MNTILLNNMISRMRVPFSVIFVLQYGRLGRQNEYVLYFFRIYKRHMNKVSFLMFSAMCDQLEPVWTAYGAIFDFFALNNGLLYWSMGFFHLYIHKCQ